MHLQRLVTVAGVGVTTFLVVGAATIEAVTAAVGGEIGPGIVGVLVGFVTGLALLLAVRSRWDRFTERTLTLLLAYAVFGLTVVFLAALSYVNVPGADQYLNVTLNLVIALVVALLVALAESRHWFGRPTAGSH